MYKGIYKPKYEIFSKKSYIYKGISKNLDKQGHMFACSEQKSKACEKKEKKKGSNNNKQRKKLVPTQNIASCFVESGMK